MKRSETVTLALTLCVFALASHPAYADAFKPVDTALDMVVESMQGTIARSVAIIAVAFLGFAAMFGRLTWMLAGSIVVGIALVFGAASIVDAIKS